LKILINNNRMIIKMNKFNIKNHNKLTNKRNKIKFNYKINN